MDWERIGKAWGSTQPKIVTLTELIRIILGGGFAVLGAVLAGGANGIELAVITAGGAFGGAVLPIGWHWGWAYVRHPLKVVEGRLAVLNDNVSALTEAVKHLVEVGTAEEQRRQVLSDLGAILYLLLDATEDYELSNDGDSEAHAKVAKKLDRLVDQSHEVVRRHLGNAELALLTAHRQDTEDDITHKWVNEDEVGIWSYRSGKATCHYMRALLERLR